MATKTPTKTKTTSKTSSDATATALSELIATSRAFTEEIQNIMTSNIDIGTKASALGTATKSFSDIVDQIEVDV